MEWLKFKLPGKVTEFTSFENPKFYSSLELAVRYVKIDELFYKANILSIFDINITIVLTTMYIIYQTY